MVRTTNQKIPSMQAKEDAETGVDALNLANSTAKTLQIEAQQSTGVAIILWKLISIHPGHVIISQSATAMVTDLYVRSMIERFGGTKEEWGKKVKEVVHHQPGQLCLRFMLVF